MPKKRKPENVTLIEVFAPDDGTLFIDVTLPGRPRATRIHRETWEELHEDIQRHSPLGKPYPCPELRLGGPAVLKYQKFLEDRAEKLESD